MTRSLAPLNIVLVVVVVVVVVGGSERSNLTDAFSRGTSGTWTAAGRRVARGDRSRRRRRLWLSASRPVPPDDDRRRDDDDSQRAWSFLRWMYDEGGCRGDEGTVRLQLLLRNGDGGGDGGRRGLYASRDASRGDCLFAVPFRSAIVIEEEETSDVERGYKWLQIKERLQQQQQQQRPPQRGWKPYLDVLPSRHEDVNFDATPDFWSDDQIRTLELPQLVDRVLEKKRSIRNVAQERGVDVRDLQFATWLVNSRAVTLVDNADNEDIDDEMMSEYLGDGHDDAEDMMEEEEEDDNDRSVLSTTCVLVPLLDMINHSSENYNTVLSVMGDDEDEDDDLEPQLYYAAVANRDIRNGEELLISYGSQEDTSLELLLHYGFVPDENPYDVDFMAWSGVGDEETPTYWSTSLQEDERRLAELMDESQNENSVERTALRFRIRMKKAYNEYRELVAGNQESS